MLKKFLVMGVLSLCAATCAFAQDDEAAETPTVWDKLGVTKALKKRQEKRDARVNKNGCSPEKERTPDLLRIADKKNLESPSELIVIAAKAKMDADLAPQKIKAIRYLATLGCGCNADVEKAVLAGLNDCTAEVRLEAVRLVVAIASKKDICENIEKKRFQRKRVLCGKCKGQGCQGCRLKGTQDVMAPVDSGADCGMCNGAEGMCGCDSCVESMESCCVCGTCCSEKIQKKLQQMAHQQDGNGCFLEPDPAIRQLAQEALCLCPCGDPMMSGGTSGPQTFDDPDPKLPTTPAPWSPLKPEQNNGVIPETGGATGETTMNYYRNSTGSINNARAVSSSQSQGYVFSEADRANMLQGTITTAAAGRVVVTFDENYLLPIGARLYISDSQGSEQLAVVESSREGFVQLKTTEASGQLNAGRNVWIGILNN